MTTLIQFSIKFPYVKPSFFNGSVYKRPTFSFSQLEPKFTSFHLGSFKLRAYRQRWSLLGGGVFKNGVLLEEKGKRVVLVRNSLRGGGGGRDDGGNTRVLVNLGLAIGLTYLTMNGQLGWIFDAIVSIWVLFSLLLLLLLLYWVILVLSANET